MKFIKPFLVFLLGGFITFLVVVFLWTKGDDLSATTQNFIYQEPALPNPMMGFAPWATAHIEDIHVPFSLVYADMTWKELEPEEGVYDFQAFEDRVHLNRWRSQNIRVVFRFVMDVPREEEHTDIPEWLYVKINGDGDHYDTSYGKGFSPNYANPILIDAHKKALDQIAERYDHDSVFAYVELGSLGHWGEWHIKYAEGLNLMPPKDVREVYIEHYINSFHNAKLLTRRPFSASSRLGLGLYNDMFGSFDPTETWLNWIEAGGDYDQANEAGELVPMKEAWRWSPIGGEITGSIPQTDIFITDQKRVFEQFERARVSFLGPGGYANPDNDALILKGQIALLHTIGYGFFVESVTLPTTIRFGDQIRGTLSLSATGIAPFYFDWPIEITAISLVDGSTQKLIFTPAISSIMPGGNMDIPFSVPIDQFQDGQADLYFSILDPKTGSPAINLSNNNNEKEEGGTKMLKLGSVNIDRPFLPLQLWFTEQIHKFNK